jgi:mersacidin/lichenicidin family type 2 lantibiotic
MSQADIIRAWRDTEYRLSLSEAEQAFLPPHPAGPSEIQKDVLMDDPNAIPISPFSIYYSCWRICEWV